MMDKIGEVFSGIISSVTSFGFFVELQAIYVEGLVHVASLPNDYFIYDAAKHHLYGERSGIRYRLGDEVTVKVVRVNLDDKKIDFELVSSSKKAGKTKTPKLEKSKKSDQKPKSEKSTKKKSSTKAGKRRKSS